MSETVFTVMLGENNTPQVKVDADSRLSCIDDHRPTSTYPWWGRCLVHFGVSVAIVVIVLLSLRVAVWVSIPRISAQETVLRIAKTAKLAFLSHPWPFAVLTAIPLISFVILYWVGCRYIVRLEKIAIEERKQRFDMRRFLVEKSIEYAEKQIKSRNDNNKDSNWSISITVNKGVGGDKTDKDPDNPQKPKQDGDNPPPKSPGMPSPEITPSNPTSPSPACFTVSSTDEKIDTNPPCNDYIPVSGCNGPATSAAPQ